MKTGLTLRGDHYYCPLALTLSTYWNCETGCAHCWLRRLNRTWGEDLRPLDVESLIIQIERARPDNTDPLTQAIYRRKTVYLGAKSDPYQRAEEEHGVTAAALDVLLRNGFSVVIATKFTRLLRRRDLNKLEQYKEKVFIMPVISPGWDRDWLLFERRKTDSPDRRLEDARVFAERGFNVGINGEPFIPGFHTVEEFRTAVRRIRGAGISSYNTYNLHLNDWNAKEMGAVGVDLEAIYVENGNVKWRMILQQLIAISKEEGVRLGCPDFVNSKDYQEDSNTCCGLNVLNPCRFNLITWKKLRAKGMNDEEILKETWDGVGDIEEGRRLLAGDGRGHYTLEPTGGLFS